MWRAGTLDANTAWSAASDGTLEERVYYCQNWRHDVVALTDDTGNQVEQVRYTAYGIPDGLPAGGDMDSDGEVDAADATAFDNLSGYDVRGDLDLDGDNDNADRGTIVSNSGNSLGFGVLSLVGNRKAYAGYEFDDALQDAYRLYHVRHRVLNSDLGRWISRDPAGYVDGMNLYGYVDSNPCQVTDPSGQIGTVVATCVAGGIGGGFGGFVGGIIEDPFDPMAWGCGALGGAAEGCCTATICAHAPPLCLPGACLCGLLGHTIDQLCMGEGFDPEDWCEWLDIGISLIVGCMGAGAVDAETLDALLLGLVGLDVQALTGLCGEFREVFDEEIRFTTYEGIDQAVLE